MKKRVLRLLSAIVAVAVMAVSVPLSAAAVVAPGPSTVSINYYKGSVTNASDSDHYLGSSGYSITVQPGDTIRLASGTLANQLNFLKPSSGYNNGVQQGTVPFVVSYGTNVINVLYPYKDNTVIVNYYKSYGSASNLLATTTYTTTGHVGDVITLPSGTGENELNYKYPGAGYENGMQYGSTTYTVKDGYNAISVVYPATSYRITVNYYKDSVSSANLMDTTILTSSAHVEQTYTLTGGIGRNQLDYKKPASGYQSGVQVDAPYNVVVGTNVINVVYYKTHTVTVNYYKDSVDAANLLGTSGLTASEGSTVNLAAGTGENQLNYKMPASGYQSGVQADAPYQVVAGTNVINVVYAAKDETVTVNYYKDSTSGILLGSSTYSTTAHVGDADITLASGTAENQLDYLKPASGYDTGVQQSAPYAIVDGTNVINVVYVQKDLTVTVNYYKASVSDANLLGSTTLTATAHVGDSDIALASGTAENQLDYLKPASGYDTGVQQSALYTIVDGTNVINVVYYEVIVDDPTPLTPPTDNSKDKASDTTKVTVIDDSSSPLAPPKTGDSTNAALIAAALLSLLSAAGVTVLVKKRLGK